jgi:hypothetical protein
MSLLTSAVQKASSVITELEKVPAIQKASDFVVEKYRPMCLFLC